jgi:hypothetical protein
MGVGYTPGGGIVTPAMLPSYVCAQSQSGSHAGAADVTAIPQHQSQARRVERLRNRCLVATRVPDGGESAQDQAAENREAAARQQHRGRVFEELARIFENVEQPGADQTREEGVETGVGRELRG